VRRGNERESGGSNGLGKRARESESDVCATDGGGGDGGRGRGDKQGERGEWMVKKCGRGYVCVAVCIFLADLVEHLLQQILHRQRAIRRLTARRPRRSRTGDGIIAAVTREAVVAVVAAIV
jgi:hypothetical protein